MDKHLIKCPCGNKFFARKPILSRTEVNKKRSELNRLQAENKKSLNELLQEKETIEIEIKEINKKIRHTDIEFREAETILQCSSCHERIPALQYEVKEK